MVYGVPSNTEFISRTRYTSFSDALLPQFAQQTLGMCHLQVFVCDTVQRNNGKRLDHSSLTRTI